MAPLCISMTRFPGRASRGLGGPHPWRLHWHFSTLGWSGAGEGGASCDHGKEGVVANDCDKSEQTVGGRGWPMIVKERDVPWM